MLVLLKRGRRRTMWDLARNRRPVVQNSHCSWKASKKSFPQDNRFTCTDSSCAHENLYFFRKNINYELTENMILQALQSDESVDTDEISFFRFLLPLGKWLTSNEEMYCVKLRPSIALATNVLGFCHTTWRATRTIFMLDDWPANHAIRTTNIAEIEEIKKIVGAYFLGKRKTLARANAIKMKDSRSIGILWRDWLTPVRTQCCPNKRSASKMVHLDAIWLSILWERALKGPKYVL